MAMGLSPRGRGNLIAETGSLIGDRSIPAWAGEPFPARPELCVQPVYPRVGGGTALGAMGDSVEDGLSPRGRGNPLCHPCRSRL